MPGGGGMLCEAKRERESASELPHDLLETIRVSLPRRETSGEPRRRRERETIGRRDEARRRRREPRRRRRHVESGWRDTKASRGYTVACHTKRSRSSGQRLARHKSLVSGQLSASLSLREGHVGVAGALWSVLVLHGLITRFLLLLLLPCR